jgi:uncharacterized membrane protein YoaK (UPF0700 family)
MLLKKLLFGAAFLFVPLHPKCCIMFKHIGKTRTLSHNLQLASLLSFVAGIVNVVGFLSVQRLTTNVTGHFAFMIEEVYRWQPAPALIFLIYVLSFFLGSFVSGFLVEVVSRKSERYMFVVPVFIEAVILLIIGLEGANLIQAHSNVIACGLLFAMGLQNSLVTTISNSIVRTTHLTGLFTDLGIELSQLIFYSAKDQQKKLISSIKLRLTIILFFFLGGIIAGAMYGHYGMKSLILCTVLLMLGMVYDTIKYQIILLRRKLQFIKYNSDK